MVSTYGTRKITECSRRPIGIARDGFGLIEFNVERSAAPPPNRGQAALYPEWSRTYLEA